MRTPIAPHVFRLYWPLKFFIDMEDGCAYSVLVGYSPTRDGAA